jgi:predicted GIY-YIG superfamily endonuclease
VSAVSERTALYRFFDCANDLLYVGITKSFGQRWLNHSQKKPWWSEVRSHTAEWLDSRHEAEAAEKQAVISERPKYNIIHKPRPKRVPVPRPAPLARVLVDPDMDYWTITEVAEHWGVKVATVRAYRSRKRGELPDPDHVYGRTPLWRPVTVINFERPGQGARTDLHDKADPQEPSDG